MPDPHVASDPSTPQSSVPHSAGLHAADSALADGGLSRAEGAHVAGASGNAPPDQADSSFTPSASPSATASASPSAAATAATSAVATTAASATAGAAKKTPASPAAIADSRIADAAAVMERIRAEFRRRRGEAPPSGRTAADRQFDAIHVRQIEHLGRLTEVPVPQSHRKRIGKYIMLVRRVLWKLLTPIVRQQSEVNAATRAVLAGLLADREALIEENRKLASRADILEARVAALEEQVVESLAKSRVDAR